MDYIVLYLIMATVALLFSFSLLVVANMNNRSSYSVDFNGSSLVEKKTELNECEKTDLNQKPSSSLSIGTNSAAILGTTLFLLVNFEIAMNWPLVISLSDILSGFYGYGEATAPVSVLADRSPFFCQDVTSYNYFRAFLLVLTFFVVISVKPYILKETGLLVLLSTAGILLMASSTNFISFYLALELISLASYILVSTTIKFREHNLNKTTILDKENLTLALKSGSSATEIREEKKNCVAPTNTNTLKAVEKPVSLAVYATNSIVAGLNYFLLSALSSGLLVLGISLIYYTTGELEFNSLARIFKINSSYVDYSTINITSLPERNAFINLIEPSVGSGIGMCLVMTFVLFKLGASPFHYWVADVYEKVSIFVNYFLIVVAKLAMLFALMKLSFGMNLPLVENLLIVASVSSLLIGSFAGLVQTKVRRLMAFSSINHVGYILLAYSFSLTKKQIFGVSGYEWEQSLDSSLGLDQGSMIITEFSKLSIASLWLYVTIYSLSTVSFFAILSLAVENGKPDATALNLSTNLTLQHLNTFAILNVKNTSYPRGVGYPSPIFITASLTITLLSLAGVPPLAGFIAKVAIFWQVLDSGNWFLATVAVLCSVIAAIYYLRIVALLYFPDTKKKSKTSAGDGTAANDLAFAMKANNLGVDFNPKKDCMNKKESIAHSQQASNSNDNLNYDFLPSSVTFLTALIISTITILLVVFPILNPSFMYLVMING